MNFIRKNRRVVVTGVGLATPLGADKNIVWKKLLDGESGIKKIEIFDPEETDCKIAGEIRFGPNSLKGEIDLDKYLSPKEAARIDRFIHHAYVASEEAIKDSNLENFFNSLDQEDLLSVQERTGVLIGSGIGGLARIERTAIDMHQFSIEKNQNNEKKSNPVRDPFFIPACLINLASGHISIKYGFKGPNISCVTACATGAHAIGDSARWISEGSADLMICGGTEAAICKLGIAGFGAMKALSTKYNDEPQKASRPWNKERDGFVMGEGAGVLILEDLEHALKRGAKIYCEIVGYGASGDAFHISAPESSGDGGRRAVKTALEMANLKISEIDYLNAHGTSTPLGDLIELKAIKNLFKNEFGESVSKQEMKNLLISSTKSSIGHLLGAAGSVEAIFSILSIEKNQIPFTLNLDESNIENDALEFSIVHQKNHDFYSNILKNRPIKTVMSNSFGFGGTNACLIFKKFE